MEEFDDLGLPLYEVRVLYKNGDCCVFSSNDFKRADKRFRRYYSLDFVSNNNEVYRVLFVDCAKGKKRFINFF